MRRKMHLQGNGKKIQSSQISLLSLAMFQIYTSKCELWLGLLREQYAS